ncbi:glyoxalase [Halpernia frigidisoli]|uniref:glyoxalase n=1 Tax=Halpernia frigidisoli TaxID=1125876 RepID=UPI001F195E8D|nr:glyoxalase [Halpernia frigidisoli]
MHINNDFPTLDFCGKVDGTEVPIPHFGCVLDEITFKEIQGKLENSDIDFLIKPQLRYTGKTGEQTTMFIFDFSGNPIEFKMLKDEQQLFK